MTKTLSSLVLTCLLGGWLGSARAQEVMAGPFAQEFRLTLGVGARGEAMGPLFSWERTLEETTWGIHPLLSETRHEAGAREFDLLYPVLTYDQFGSEARWQLFQVLNLTRTDTQDGQTIRRFTVFPFYFSQRSPDGRDDYTAVFPFYGQLRNRLARNEIRWIAWPFYVETRKGASLRPEGETGSEGTAASRWEGGYTTRNYMFPFVHVREGENLHGWQVWPLVGYEEKAFGTRTNVWGDIEQVAGHRKSLVLWPFYFNEHRQLGTENPEHQVTLLPFYSRLRSPQRDFMMAPWPLGVAFADDRAKGYREWGMPWPIVVFARGPGKTTDRVWPFYGRTKAGGLSSESFFWPLYKASRIDSAPLWRERVRVLGFLYSDVTEKNTQTGEASRRTDLWPLFTARQDADGSRRLQLLAIGEPLLPTNKAVRRNWSPLWSLWTSERNARTGQASVSVLWNLYRRESDATSRKGSMLFGLFQYQSNSDGKRWRVLGIPFGARAAAAARSGS